MSYPIAINIAFIPEQSALQHSLSLSQALADTQGSPYLLGRDGLPHVTLLQGVVANYMQMDQLKYQLQAIVDQLVAPELISEGLLIPRNTQSLWWKIEATTILKRWHEQIIDSCSPFLCVDIYPTTDMFANQAHVRDRDLSWVAHYLTQATHQHFMPHFTLGYGQETKSLTVPDRVKVQQLGLFQLGPYCSCYRALETWAL